MVFGWLDENTIPGRTTKEIVASDFSDEITKLTNDGTFRNFIDCSLSLSKDLIILCHGQNNYKPFIIDI